MHCDSFYNMLCICYVHFDAFSKVKLALKGNKIIHSGTGYAFGRLINVLLTQLHTQQDFRCIYSVGFSEEIIHSLVADTNQA